jgi:hypothetical protein
MEAGTGALTKPAVQKLDRPIRNVISVQDDGEHHREAPRTRYRPCPRDHGARARSPRRSYRAVPIDLTASGARPTWSPWRKLEAGNDPHRHAEAHPDFNPGVQGQPNRAVNALAISNDGRTLYVGGAFDNIGGQPRNNLAAIDLTTRQVTRFDPAGLGTDGPVHALEVAGTQVYVGGEFRLLGGQTRNGLAKVAGNTGGDLGWVPNPTEGAVIRAIEASPDSPDSVYVGGRFTGIGGQPYRNLARLSATSGLAYQGFAPNPRGGRQCRDDRCCP